MLIKIYLMRGKIMEKIIKKEIEAKKFEKSLKKFQKSLKNRNIFLQEIRKISEFEFNDLCYYCDITYRNVAEKILDTIEIETNFEEDFRIEFKKFFKEYF